MSDKFNDLGYQLHNAPQLNVTYENVVEYIARNPHDAAARNVLNALAGPAMADEVEADIAAAQDRLARGKALGESSRAGTDAGMAPDPRSVGADDTRDAAEEDAVFKLRPYFGLDAEGEENCREFVRAARKIVAAQDEANEANVKIVYLLAGMMKANRADAQCNRASLWRALCAAHLYTAQEPNFRSMLRQRLSLM